MPVANAGWLAKVGGSAYRAEAHGLSKRIIKDA
jgi:hypothetical protein